MKYIYLFFIILNVTVSADTQIDKAANSQILFEKQKEQFQKMEENSNKKILFYDTEKPKLKEIKKEGECIEIKKIKENTITLLSKKEKKVIFQHYEGACRTLTELNNLRKELMQLYINKGYVTSQVYFKPQKMSQGILEIHAIEGKIKKITPTEPYIKNAFLGIEDAFLNLRDLEDSVETINKLSSNHATIKLIPADEVGTTTIHVDNNVTKRVNGSIGINNFGDKTSSTLQGDLTLNIDNPIGINDQLSFSLNSINKHITKRNFNGGSYQYSFPIGGKLSTIFKYNKTSYKKLIPAGITTYEATGHTSTYTLNLSYKMFHNQNNRINLGAFVSHYKSKNFISNILIETSSYNLSKAGVNFDYLYQMPDFYSYLAVSYMKGNNWFGDYNPTALDEHFSLYTIDLSLMKKIATFKYTLYAHYQYTHNPLFSLDQISIGGPYSVRGYKKEGLSGNSGYYARNELSKMVDTKFLDYFEQSYFIALDSGWIKKEEDVASGKLLSYTLGAKYAKDNFSTQIYYATPLRKDDVTQTNKFFGISMSYKY